MHDLVTSALRSTAACKEVHLQQGPWKICNMRASCSRHHINAVGGSQVNSMIVLHPAHGCDCGTDALHDPVHVSAAAGPAILEAFHATKQSTQAVHAHNGSCKGWCDGIYQLRMNELLSISSPSNDTS